MKLQSLRRAALVLACTAVTWTSAQAATVYDVAADFSTSSNTASSTWSYRSGANLAHDGNYALLSNFAAFGGFTGPVAATSGWTAGGVPAIGLNSSGADQYFVGFGPGAQFTWQAGAMFLHPGSSSLAVVSWLSPTASTLALDFRFADLDANLNFGDGVAWSVEKNGSGGGAVLASGTFSNGGNSGALSLLNISVAAGDRIQFIVSPNGDFQGDSTRLSAVITAASPVPEPSSLALCLAGVGLLAARGKFRRRRH